MTIREIEVPARKVNSGLLNFPFSLDSFCALPTFRGPPTCLYLAPPTAHLRPALSSNGSGSLRKGGAAGSAGSGALEAIEAESAMSSGLVRLSGHTVSTHEVKKDSFHVQGFAIAPLARKRCLYAIDFSHTSLHIPSAQCLGDPLERPLAPNWGLGGVSEQEQKKEISSAQRLGARGEENKQTNKPETTKPPFPNSQLACEGKPMGVLQLECTGRSVLRCASAWALHARAGREGGPPFGGACRSKTQLRSDWRHPISVPPGPSSPL